MPAAFVDTGAWIALMVARDQHHARATDFFRNLPPRTRLITSDLVVAETVTWLVYHGQRQAAFRLRDLLAAAEQQHFATVEWSTPARHETAWLLLERFDDQQLSFVDCISFVMCHERKVDFVFGFDDHFRAAGFDLRPGV